MRSLPLAASSLSNLPDNPTPLPDERDDPSSGLSRHRRVSNQNLTTTRTLLMPDTPAIVGFVGFCRGMGATNRK